jgi:hypothetical protein
VKSGNSCTPKPKPAPSHTCGYQSAHYGFISNSHNIATIKHKTLSQCIAECNARSNCKAFSYEKGKSTSSCWLKNDMHSVGVRGNTLYSSQVWYTYIVRDCTLVIPKIVFPKITFPEWKPFTLPKISFNFGGLGF